MLEWMNERTVLSVQVLGRWYDFFWARFVKMDGREDGDGTCRQEIKGMFACLEKDSRRRE
jgi:hypothetical protein